MADPRPGTFQEQIAAAGIKLRWPIEERLRRYDVAENGCWIWRGEKDFWGYGVFHAGSRKGSAGYLAFQAHRVSYEVQVGPIPPGLVLDHLCRNPGCVNPEHLEPVTVRENLMRGEGIGAKNSRKTHCKHGHEFTPENTIVRPRGRACRICDRVKQRRYRERKALSQSINSTTVQ